MERLKMAFAANVSKPKTISKTRAGSSRTVELKGPLPKAMNIGDGTDSRYGKMIIVKANPVIDNGYGKSFISHINSNTETFFFPASQQSIIEQLIQIANGGGFWTPDLMKDFQPEFVMDENSCERKRIFRHRSFYGGTIDYNRDVNGGHKIQLISDKTYGYVESLAEDDTNTHFWQWLFNTPKYNTFLPVDIPSEYYAAYREFIELCSRKDLPF